MNQTVKQNRSAIAYFRQVAWEFLNRETTGGLLLIGATILALILGNSQWAHTYHHFLEAEFLFELSEHFTFSLSIEQWINDGLMAIFFLVAGLELKREILVGELSTFKKASMPLIGAFGGMVVPALIFASLNAGTENIRGWGIPMATDIAYSLGIIGLLGKRVPIQLKVFLVALAIADDLGAILVIAIFYSQELSWIYLGVGAGIFTLLMLFNRMGIKSLYWYIPGGLVLWYCFLNSGIHPTIAGVLFAITIPGKPELDGKSLKRRTIKNVAALEDTNLKNHVPLLDVRQLKLLNDIKKDTENAEPPLAKLEHSLIDFNAFFIIPVFAIANAGVKLDVSLADVLDSSLGLGVFLGLVMGKVLGISLFSFFGVKLGISVLHTTLRWKHVIGMGMIAGIGFTMSLFITNLAFISPDLIKISKISILIASLIAASLGILVLYFTKPRLNQNPQMEKIIVK